MSRLGLVAAAAVAVLAGGCGPPPSKCGAATGLVLSVVDGDTVTLEGGVKIRYTLVDTPELSKNECFATQARDFNRTQVLGQAVSLKYDEAQCQDRFGRTLAFVTNAETGIEVNSLLVKQGYGCVLHIPPAGNDRAAEFKALEAEAKGARRGVWGCTPVPCAN